MGHTPVIAACRRLKQEEQEFQPSLDYIARLFFEKNQNRTKR
jgi:hypothetical protein